jgi:hypothetical protein
MAEERARWVAELLATSIQVSGMSEEELERRLGWSPGSVGRLLESESELDPDRVLEILDKLKGESRLEAGPDPAECEDGTTQVVTDLLDQYRALGYKLQEVAPPAEARLELPELEKRVESILRKAFGASFDEES